MTATFGKLENQTLTLQPGLNVIEAPNEWGKSTWCAFLLAMLYGIDTSARSKKDYIAEKERYAPWSGAPMSGTMDICWNGRDITIQRSTRGRSIFGQFRAYETHTGVEVPELTAANCGEKLLGVEQSVYARAGFIRLRDMPLTQDEALRRRLNALVTTGDESGSSEDLAQKLKELKNRCRFNRSGLLPQAESQYREVSDKLEEMESLQRQGKAIDNRRKELKEYQAKLENHRQALDYAADQNFAGKMAVTRAQLEIAAERVEALEGVCGKLPSPQMLQLKKLQLQQLTEKKEALQMEQQMLPPLPQLPDAAPQFRGADPQEVVARTQADSRKYAQLLAQIKPTWPILWLLGAALLVGGILLFAMDLGFYWMLPGAVITVLGVVIQVSRSGRNRESRIQAQALAQRYEPLSPGTWDAEAGRYAQAWQTYLQQQALYTDQREELEMRLRDIDAQLETLTEGRTPAHFEQELEGALMQIQAYGDALRERSRLEEMVVTLEASHKEIQPPEFADELTFTREQTDRVLSDVMQEQRQLQHRAGQCQGRMEALGSEDLLRQQLQALRQRIAQLEEVHSALQLAQQTLDQAKQELQRRFAPRIAQRAQELFGAFTHSRYQKLTLGEDLTAATAATDENVLRSSLWRSEGTADQLYLALRLAVAEALTPDAPLVLDDALVRFDDRRLDAAMEVLQESGRQKQVLLFTCQSRENKYLEE